MPTPNSPPPGKIYNPATKRYVKIDGKVGKSILAAAAAAAVVSSKKKTPNAQVAASSKSKILEELKKKCNNDSDPISMDDFEKLSVQELKNLVMIGKKDKKNCYMLENIYHVYKTAIESNKPAKDPMDMSHTLTDAEIDDINNKMKALNVSYVPPVYKPPRVYPEGYALEIELSPIHMNYFSIKVIYNDRVKFDLGIIPGWVEAHHTGSADFTSGVLIANLYVVWESGKFLDSSNNCVVRGLRRQFSYWQKDWKKKFIALCEEIKAMLE